MTRITSLSLNRRYEGKDLKGNLIPRKEKIDIPRESYEITCSGHKFQIKVSPGQAINTNKMCKKLLKELREKNNGNKEKKFVSKGYKGQNTF